MAGLGVVPLAGIGVGTVLGCVALWGRVVEHSEGWRGEHGYPLVLIVMSAAQSDVATLVRRLSRLRARSSIGTAAVPEDADGVQALSRELARLYGIPVYPAPALVGVDPVRGGRPSGRIADGVMAEAVTGLARRREGDPEACARLDRRVRDLIGSVGA